MLVQAGFLNDDFADSAGERIAFKMLNILDGKQNQKDRELNVPGIKLRGFDKLRIGTGGRSDVADKAQQELVLAHHDFALLLINENDQQLI